MPRTPLLRPALQRPEISTSTPSKSGLSRRTRIAGAVVGAAVTAAATCGVAVAATGPDVSAWQHPQSAAINWSQVAGAGNTFVFIKATEGSSYVNPWWSADRNGARSAGMAVGAYDFAEPGVTSGAAEARHFASVIGPQNGPGQLPPVLDLEVTGGRSPSRLISWVGDWLRTTRALTHRTPMIYTSPSFWASYLRNTHSYAKYPLWVADWGVGSPALPGGWHHWLFWQYTASARVAGLKGRIDEDRYAGTTAQFRSLAHLGSGTSSGGSTGTGSGPTLAKRPTGTHRSTKQWTEMRLSVPATAQPSSPVTLSGAVTTYKGRPVPKARVVLQRRGQQGKWQPIAKFVAGSAGRFTRHYRVNSSVQVRAVSSATKRYQRAVSNPKTIQVAAD